MNKLKILFILLSLSSSLRAQLFIDFTWCPVYDTTSQMCCIQFQNLTVDSGGGIFGGYNWDFGDGVIDTATDPLHCYPVTGTFIVNLIGYYDGNPVQGNFQQLTINYLDTTDCNCDSLIGVNEFRSQDFSFSISPNPFRENTTVYIHANGNRMISDAEIRIYNSIGELVRIENITVNAKQEFMIEKKSLQPGLYHFEMISGNQRQSGRGKFVVE